MTTIFQDSKDRAWTLGITFGDIKRVLTLVGVNLAKPGRQLPKDIDAVSIADLPDEDQPLYFRLSTDAILLIDVVFALVEPQAKEKGVDAEEFGMSITPAMFADISNKFWEVYHVFFLEAGDMLQAKLIEQVKRARKEMEKRSEQVSQMIDNAVDKKISEAMEEIETTLR